MYVAFCLKAQEIDIISRHLQSFRDLGVTRGMQEREVLSFENTSETHDIFIKVLIDGHDDKLTGEISEYLETNNLGVVIEHSESVNNADIVITYISGMYDISASKNWASSRVIIKERIADIDELKESIVAYAQGKFLRELNIKGSEEIFSFKLLHVDYDVENHKIIATHDATGRGVFQVTPEDDFAVLEITNHSSYPISVEILEINIAGVVSGFFPNMDCTSASERYIPPRSTVRFEDCVYSFAPPYEMLTLKAFAKIEEKTNYHSPVQKPHLYAQAFEYSIVEEKNDAFEDIVKRHSSMSSSLIVSRGALIDQEAYKFNFSVFSNKQHDEDDILDLVNSYSKNVGLCIYTYIDDRLNILLYTKDGKVYDKSITITKEKLTEDINNINNYFSNRSLHRSPVLRGSKPSQTSTSLIEKEKLLKTINETLLPPIAFLGEVEHLIIVPTLNIATIPFYTLQFSNEEYLVDKMSYSVAPSLIELLFRIDESNPYQREKSGYVQYDFENALLVANPTFSTSGKWDFPSLPGTEEEINSIADLIGIDKYILLKGDDATSQRVFYEFKTKDLLYFATHGIADPENPLDNSFLALAEDDDFIFSARRIQHEEIASNLVILSACQTGLGQTHEGGVIGLARAFQLAGANNVLSSLWNIDDKETVVIMTDFFRNIQQGGELMPHEALRQAILKYKNEVNTDPYYWSAFMIFGVPY